jgi:hypothetical protein
MRVAALGWILSSFFSSKRALLIEVQRSGPFAAARVTAHERTPCLLVEWIEPEQVLSVIDRIGKRSFPFKQANKAHQDLLCADADFRGRHRSSRRRNRAARRLGTGLSPLRAHRGPPSPIRGGVEGDQVHDGVTVFIPREK